MYTLCIHLTLHICRERMTSCHEQSKILSVAMTTIQEEIRKNWQNVLYHKCYV